MTRILLFLLAGYQGLNGAVMLAAPEFWYATVPGVEHTGPANIHFIRDIGLGFLAAASALWLVARGHVLLLVPAIVFLGGHAGLHLVEMVAHRMPLDAALRDLLLIVVPGLLPLAALLPGHRAVIGRAV